MALALELLIIRKLGCFLTLWKYAAGLNKDFQSFHPIEPGYIQATCGPASRL
jgi:hypothetical protein